MQLNFYICYRKIKVLLNIFANVSFICYLLFKRLEYKFACCLKIFDRSTVAYVWPKHFISPASLPYKTENFMQNLENDHTLKISRFRPVGKIMHFVINIFENDA